MSIDITYFAFDTKRADARWAEVEQLDLEKIADVHQTAREAAHNPQKKELAETSIIPPYLERTDFLFDLWPRKSSLPWMTQEPKSITAHLQDLMILDLAFGSVEISLSDPDNEERFLTALFSLFMPETLAEEPMGVEHLMTQKIVPLFEKMSKEKIYQGLTEASDELLQTIEITPDDLDWFPDALIDFAFEIRPLAKDIKNTGSRLIITGGGTELEDAELNERAQRRLLSLHARFPWIKSRLDR